MTKQDLMEIFGVTDPNNIVEIATVNHASENPSEGSLRPPQVGLNCGAWLEEHRSLYEANKDVRFLREESERPGYITTHALDPDDPRYVEGYVPLFVQKYRRCLELLQECDQLVKEMSLEHP